MSVVVGAASGIGRATARRLAERGRVVLVDVATDAVACAAAELPGEGHLALTADVTRPDSLAAAADALREQYGTLQALVVTAGVVTTQPTAEISWTDVAHVFDVNVLGTLATVQAHLPMLRESPGDRSVVLMSSIAASVGGGLLGTAVYASSKAAVEGLTRGLARELARDGIRVNAVAPGPVDTPLVTDRLAPHENADDLAGSTLMDRSAAPEEIADLVDYLSGPRAAYVTGQVVHANGGAYFG